MPRTVIAILSSVLFLIAAAGCKKKKPEPAPKPPTPTAKPTKPTTPTKPTKTTKPPGPETHAAPTLEQWKKDIKSPDPKVREMALSAMPPGDHKRPPKGMIKGLVDKEASVRKAAIRGVLGFILQFSDTSAMSRLFKLATSDPSAEVKAEAVRALGALNHRSVVPKLLSILGKEKSRRIQDEILAILARAGDRRARGVLQKMLAQPAPSPLVFDALRAIETKASPQLLGFLGHKSAQLRARAAQALGDIGDAAAVPKLIQLLKDSSSKVVSAALSSLALLGHADSVAPIMALCESKDAKVRVMAIEALGNYRSVEALKSKEAFATLIKHLQKDSTEVRVAAARALGSLRVMSAEPMLTEIEKGKGPGALRVAALEALGMMGDPKVLPTLVAGLSDKNDDIRTAAAQAIGNLGRAASSASKDLVARWKKGEADIDAKLEILKALGKINATDAKGLLVNVAKSDPVPLLRVMAAGALLQMQQMEGVDVMKPLLISASQWQERREAARALEVRRWRERRDAAKSEGGAKFAGAVASLIVSALSSEKEPLVRETLYRQLAKAVGPEAAKAQRAALRSARVPYFRLLAAAGLCRGQDPEGCKVVVQALNSPDATMREEAAKRSRWYRVAGAKAALRRNANDPVLAVALASKRALQRLTGGKEGTGGAMRPRRRRRRPVAVPGAKKKTK